MVVFRGEFKVDTSGNSDIIDITPQVRELVALSGMSDGILLVYVPGSTAAITTIEFEPGLIRDMKAALERLAPENITYYHNERWHDGNGHSHIRASFLGQSGSFPLTDGSILLGTWQQIILIDLDNRPRSRVVLVQMYGE
ncbi:secondary thiamine-phosphate synthase enzyme YjbQ [Methanolobus profundi]|uniref:Secondary thiamine-phosphate synthase enzyme n=1 Tax=Methanolobus profundi TaxID=487685 RepID=A0A1I4QRV2_9EURY|nr:secondary thiamine-phosphate synthase enzyme YjbQ [Methanolobus profundi]SFM42769.1 secondary thiamine-phosphate synthase enzyme [Methanolobus profundi]